MDLLPGTEVQGPGLCWKVVPTIGCATRRRAGREIDLLHSFEQVTPIYQDLQVATFNVGVNLSRDRHIRELLRTGRSAWRVEELRAADLAHGVALVERLVLTTET